MPDTAERRAREIRCPHCDARRNTRLADEFAPVGLRLHARCDYCERMFAFHRPTADTWASEVVAIPGERIAD